MNRDKDSMLQAMKQYLENFEKLAKENPEEAKIQAKESLIRCGVLNEDGSPKEHIVTEPHIGYDEPSMSYEDIVSTMRECYDGLKKLGEGDRKKTHDLMCQSLLDSRFIDRNGHIIVPEKRSPQVEEFFRRIESQCNISGRQRVRK